METKATLKVVRARVKRVLIYSKIENAILCSLPWTQVANFILLLFFLAFPSYISGVHHFRVRFLRM